MEPLIGANEFVFLPLEHGLEGENGWNNIGEELTKDMDGIFCD